ncbi:MAG: hypothetical protein JNL83_01865 [Myxococcales bacterium]|nr:hypothetical protein [Myxococcales bacterium]
MGEVTGIVLLSMAAGSIAVAAGRRLVERRRARRALRERAPLDRSSPEGTEVRVTGIVRVLDETLEAPLSGVRCVVYRSRMSPVEGFVLWARVQKPLEQARMVPFALELPDKSRVIVDSRHALLDLDPIKKLRADETRRQQLGLALGLAVRQQRASDVEETVVTEGMRVTVGGLVMKDVSPEPTSEERAFRDEQRAQLRIAGDAAHPIAIGSPMRAGS